MNNGQEIKFSNYVINETALFAEAMKAITATHRGSIVVIDSDGKLIGIISDGDIRRAMLKGAIMQTPIISAINRNVISIASDEFKSKSGNCGAVWAKHPYFNLIPVVDQNNIVVEVLVRDTAPKQ